MNQTKKRLAIIKLAISVTDKETIQLQVLKLSLLKTDNRIQDILTVLNTQNYIQAQKLISAYIDAPIKEILQRTSQEENHHSPITLEKTTEHTPEEKKIIDEFELYIVNPNNAEKSPKTTQYDTAIKTDTTPKKSLSDKAINYNSLLNINTNEINENKLNIQDENKEVSNPSHTSKTEKTDYEAMPYIHKKLKNMQTQYPPVYHTNETFESLDIWLNQIAKNGYSETEIEKKIKEVESLIYTNKSQAALLLLSTASTASTYAQFRLARALFRGEILQKNISEAFSIMHRLALQDNYPEALCDLAQFYENGIGTAQDKTKATTLYKEAMGLGVKRAGEHYIRIQEKSRGLFSFFRK